MTRRSAFLIAMLAAAIIAALPLEAHAQLGSAIAGVVKDTTGAVLPGVTVEAASPELIEKVRSAVTDERGLYQVVDLRPGTYTVTFTLTGFSSVKREGIELPASFTATVNADLRDRLAGRDDYGVRVFASRGRAEHHEGPGAGS